MGLVRTHYNPYRTKIKKAAEGMVVSSENAINENPNIEEEEKSKKQQRLEKKLAKLESKISEEKKKQEEPEYYFGGSVNKYTNGGDIVVEEEEEKKEIPEFDGDILKQGTQGQPKTGPMGGELASGEMFGGMGGASGAGVAGGVGSVAAIGTMGIEAFEDPDKQSVKKKGRVNVAKGALKGAAAGATAGAVFGPWGAAVGAVIGATFGGIKAKKENRKMVKELKTDRIRADKDARLAMSKEAQQASNQYLAGLNADKPQNPYTTPGVKSMKTGGVIAELTGGEYVIPENWDDAIQKASDSGNKDMAKNIYNMAPKQKTGGEFSHETNPIYVYADGDTEDEDGNKDAYVPEGSGIYNPKQHKNMKKGNVKLVMNEQRTKGHR